MALTDERTLSIQIDTHFENGHLDLFILFIERISLMVLVFSACFPF
jgi:hypothetical protein